MTTEPDPPASLADLAAFHMMSIEDDTDIELRRAIGASINLMEYVNRGTVAEAIVALALGGRVTEAWGDWDVELPDRTRLEVKSTGSVQSWPQNAASPPRWSIGKTQGWVLTDDQYEVVATEERCSDYYVLAVHTGLRPDDMTEWRFYVIPTAVVDARLGDQKTISEASLVTKLDVSAMNYAELCTTRLTRP